MIPLASLLLALAPASGQDQARSTQLSYVEITGAISSLALDGGFLEIEAGDVNGDGHPDLVSVGDHGSPFVNTQQHGVTVWLGDGQGGWTLVQTGNFGYGGCALGDVDGDGLMDVAYGVHHDYASGDLGDQLLEVALGDGSGAAWTPWDDGLATNGETWGMFGTDLGDIDADGDLDVGSTSFGCCAGVHVYRNLSDGTWSQSFGFLGGNSDSRLEFADFNGDGDLDLAAAHQSGAAWLGDGTGGFSAADGNLPGTHYIGVTAGDLDGDGHDELAFVLSGQARVFSWGAGNVWSERTTDLASIAPSSVQEIAFADMDVDGDAELLLFGNGGLVIASMTPAGTWERLYRGVTAGSGSRPGVLLRSGVDLDHNGFPDIWLVQEEPAGLFVTRNVHRVLAEASTPTQLALHPLAPQPGRVWRGGQVRFVDWAAAVPPGTGSCKLTIALSTTDGAPPYQVLAAGVPDCGRAQVVVPSGISSSTCRLLYVISPPGQPRMRVNGPRFTILP